MNTIPIQIYLLVIRFLKKCRALLNKKMYGQKTGLFAYKGSMLQFMRSLYNRTLTENGFELQYIVKTNDEETIPLKIYMEH